MFTQAWRKYLPVIIILMKRSFKGDQVLDMSEFDFQKAAGGRKIKLSFDNLQLNKGVVNYGFNHQALAKDLAVLLQEDSSSRYLVSTERFELSMNSNCQLLIRNTSTADEAVKDDAAV